MWYGKSMSIYLWAAGWIEPATFQSMRCIHNDHCALEVVLLSPIIKENHHISCDVLGRTSMENQWRKQGSSNPISANINICIGGGNNWFLRYYSNRMTIILSNQAVFYLYNVLFKAVGWCHSKNNVKWDIFIIFKILKSVQCLTVLAIGLIITIEF